MECLTWAAYTRAKLTRRHDLLVSRGTACGGTSSPAKPAQFGLQPSVIREQGKLGWLRPALGKQDLPSFRWLPKSLPRPSSPYLCLRGTLGCHPLAVTGIKSTIKASSLILNAVPLPANSAEDISLCCCTLLNFHLISRESFQSDPCKKVIFRTSCPTRLWAHRKGRAWPVLMLSCSYTK